MDAEGFSLELKDGNLYPNEFSDPMELCLALPHRNDYNTQSDFLMKRGFFKSWQRNSLRPNPNVCWI